VYLLRAVLWFATGHTVRAGDTVFGYRVTYIHIYIKFVNIHTCTYVYIYIFIRIYLFIYVYIYIYIYMYVCIFRCTYIYIHLICVWISTHKYKLLYRVTGKALGTRGTGTTVRLSGPVCLYPESVISTGDWIRSAYVHV
jgi:hypothetical protein